MLAKKRRPDIISIATPKGTSELPVYEFLRNDVTKPLPKQKHAVAKASGKLTPTERVLAKSIPSLLTLDEWDFHQSAKKTELCRPKHKKYLKRAAMRRRAAGFYAAHGELLVWTGGNLRLSDGASELYEDFSRTYIAGRFGEASTHLFMLDQQYVFWDHLPSLVLRALGKLAVQHPEHLKKARAIKAKLASTKGLRQPDFAYENHAQEVALTESKGSLLSPLADVPDIRSRLKNALEQIEDWLPHITPRPSKFYACATYLREQYDPTTDSLLAFVDPQVPNRGGADGLFPSDWIRRGNFGAWLIGMGFVGSGEALRNGLSRRTTVVSLPTITVGGRLFAYTMTGITLDRESPEMVDEFRFVWDERRPFWEWFDPLYMHQDYAKRFGLRWTVTGLLVDNLRLIESALLDGEDRSLLRVEPIPRNTTADADFEGSVLPDGSLLGSLGTDAMGMQTSEKFKL